MKVEAFGKDFSSLQNIVNEETKICIYGCGVNGEIICKYLRDLGRDIEFFVDKQAENREFSVLDKRVISPNTFLKLKEKIKVIVSPDNQKAVIKFLLDNGIKQKNIIDVFKTIEKEIRVLEDEYDVEQFEAKEQINNSQMIEVRATIFTIMYNTPRGMLCRTIESILKQTYKEFTYLIIDNGSTDDSADTIKAYMKKDGRIRYIRLDKNVVWGSKELLTVLKDNIQSTYVAMVDSDDYYEPDFLEKSIKTAKENEADIVQVNTLTYGHEGFRYSYYNHYLGEDACLEGKEKESYFMLRILSTPVWGKLYRTELFKDLIGMMLSYESAYERDRNFCLDISWITYMVYACKRISLCDDILHIRTWRPGSSEHSDDHSSKWLSSIMWAFRHLREHGTSYEDAQVFEEAALMWLFSLNRNKYDLSKFREIDIADKRVEEFLKRPVCDKFRGK